MKIGFKALPFVIKLLKLEAFEYRGLTQGEIRLCQQVFGDLIHYDQVKVLNQPYLPWQPIHVFMAPCGYIHARKQNFSQDYSKDSLAYQAVFIHEMAHIFQYQQKINVLLHGAFLQTALYLSFGKYNPYEYTFEQGKDFFDYNIEQQGDIARDIFLKRINNIILKTNRKIY
jgi:hypothetical protein